MPMLTEPMEHLAVELQRLDLLLHREILRLRASYQLSLDEFRGLYISDEQVNQLINRALNYDRPNFGNGRINCPGRVTPCVCMQSWLPRFTLAEAG